ncbi:hypothetical protein CWO70_23205 [Salmonella enterica]|nr:hypothetical protein CWO70_23205 [Salmonella enterica]
MINAFIATEDSRFYEHHGIDPVGIFSEILAYCSSDMLIIIKTLSERPSFSLSNKAN